MAAVEVYVSTDIETDGPLPSQNSMLSFGSAAFTLQKGLIGTFSANLKEMVGCFPDPRTKAEFWDKNPEAWAACRTDPRDPREAMTAYVAWVRGLPGTPVFVGYPATFDFLFMYFYMGTYGLESPFSFAALDIKSYAMAVLKKSFRDTTKKSMPKSWFSKAKHTHVAIDDAVEQGELFMNILRSNLGT